MGRVNYDYPFFEGDKGFHKTLEWAAETFDDSVVLCTQRIFHLNKITVSEISSAQIMEAIEIIQSSERCVN